MFGKKKKSNEHNLNKRVGIIDSIEQVCTYSDAELDYLYSYERDTYNEELSVTTSHKNSFHFHLAILGLTGTVGITLLFTILTIDGIVIVGIEKMMLYFIMAEFSTNIIILFATSYFSYTTIDKFTDYKTTLSNLSDYIQSHLQSNLKSLNYHKLRASQYVILVIKRKIQNIFNLDNEVTLTKVTHPQYTFICATIISSLILFGGVLESNAIIANLTYCNDAVVSSVNGMTDTLTSSLPLRTLIMTLIPTTLSFICSTIYFILNCKNVKKERKSISDKIKKVFESPLGKI